MKQRWIAVARILPKSTHPEDDAQDGRRRPEGRGLLDGKYLDTQFYPRLLITGATPPPTPVAEESYLVFLGPFRRQAEAENCASRSSSVTGESLRRRPARPATVGADSNSLCWRPVSPIE